jgi:CHASE3 domain sensor protein
MIKNNRKYFNRLKIGGKLTIGFGILGALTMLVIGLSYLGSYRATLNINRTGDVRVPIALASARAQANLLRMRADMQAYLALGDQTYRESFQQARQAFEENLAELDRLAHQHAASASNQEFDRGLEALKNAYTEWSALPEQLFDLRDDQLKREPALRLLIEEANPLIIPILVDINGMITTQQQRDPTAENLALLGDMANFQASFFAMVAGLRGYVTTGRDSFQFEYTSNLTVNDSAWEQLVNQRVQLESNQREKLHHISQAREAFLALPPKMFGAVRGEHAREDLFLFRTQAVPLAEAALRLLDELTTDEQNLLQADLSEGREQLAAAQRQTLAGGAVAFFLGLALAFIFRENIAGPIRRLTRVAEQIGAGDLTAQAPFQG